MLQRAWNPDPQNLPFAPYIKTHALVTLVQKGLQYHELEQSIDQVRSFFLVSSSARVFVADPSGFFSFFIAQPGNVPPESLPSFFGPKVSVSQTTPRQDENERKVTGGAAAAETSKSPPSTISSVHKPTVDGTIANGNSTVPPTSPAPEKGRKSEATENGTAVTAGPDENANAMDVDSKENLNPPSAQTRESAAAPSPIPSDTAMDADGDIGMRGQQPPEPPTPTFTLTNGQSVGIQIVPAKSTDLTPNTTLVDVTDGDHVTQTIWRPNDSTLVVAAGDTFCGLWKASGQRIPNYNHVLLGGKSSGADVTAVAWDATGSLLAVANYKDMVATVTMFNQNGRVIDLLPDIPRMVSGLHWAPKGSRMVVVSCDGEHTELALWDQDVRSDELPTPQVISGQVYDVCWLGDDEVCACGDGVVYRFTVDDNLHVPTKYYLDYSQESLTFVRAAKAADSTVVAAASSTSTSIWLPTHDVFVKTTHHGDMTAMEFRPHSTSSSPAKNAPLTLATSSMDESVKIWNIDPETGDVQCIHRLYLGSSSPALASKFSPDGYAIAAMSHHHLLIWNIERGTLPIAKWKVPTAKDSEDPAQEDQTMAIDDSQPSSFERALSWDSDGKKLAIGFDKQVCYFSTPIIYVIY